MMALLDTPRIQSLTQHSITLRQELKEWEKSFAAVNEGRKARREDIKKDAAIAAKYKDYNRLRNKLSKGDPTEPSSRRSSSKVQGEGLESPKKRKRCPLEETQPSLPQDSTYPRKFQKQTGFSTPLKSRLQPRNHGNETPCTLQKPFSPSRQGEIPSPYAFRTSIGPTPQRDGKVLGLFDMLSQSGGSVKSPVPGKDTEPSGEAAAERVVQTPSKRKDKASQPLDVFLNVQTENQTPKTRRHSRTPASSGRRFLFSNFLKTPKAFKMTPTKPPRKHKDVNVVFPDLFDAETSATSDTPASPNSRRPYASLLPIDEVGELSPVAVRMPSKPLGRSLSTLVQSLRDMEEKEMDDDMEAMREIEKEELHSSKPVDRRKILVQDSQSDPFQMGYAENFSDFMTGSEPTVEEDLESGSLPPGEPPAKNWKKKGLKRQTKRVIMKPRAKPQPLSQPITPPEESHNVVLETQNDGPTKFEADGDSNEKEPAKKYSVDSNIHEPVDGKKTQSSTKAAKSKKHHPFAHANFRALKIKNKNSKAKGRGKFGRRK